MNVMKKIARIFLPPYMNIEGCHAPSMNHLNRMDGHGLLIVRPRLRLDVATTNTGRSLEANCLEAGLTRAREFLLRETSAGRPLHR
jgi:hypothetical protein